MSVVRYLLLTCLLLVFGAALSAVWLINSDFVRVRAEQTLSNALDRDVSIGNHQIELGEILTLRLSNIRIAAPSWSEDPTFAALGSLDMEVALESLFEQPIHIRSINIDGLALNLEEGADGATNWTFGEADTPVAEESNAERPSLPVLIDRANVRGLAINLRTPERQARQLKLNIAQSLAEDALKLTLEGTLNETPVDLAFGASPLNQLINFGATRLTVDGHLGEIAVDGNVAVKDLLRPRRPELDLALKGPSIEYLTDRLGIDPISSGPLDMTASAHPLDEQMAFDIRGQFGEFHAALNGAFDDLRTLQQGAVTLALSGPSSAKVGALFGQQDLPDLPFSIAGRAARSGSQLVLEDTRLTVGKVKLDARGVIPDLDFPTQANLNATLNVPDLASLAQSLSVPTTIRGAALAKMEVKAGESAADVVGKVTSDYGTINLSGQLMRNKELSGSELTVSIADDAIEKLLTLLPANNAEQVAVEQTLEQTLRGPWQIESRIAVVADQYQIKQGRFTLGDDHVGFSGTIDRASPAEQIQFFADGNISTIRQYLKHLLDRDTLALIPEGPLQLSTQGRFNGRQLELGKTEFNFAGLQASLQSNTELVSGHTKSTFTVTSDLPARWVPTQLLPEELNRQVLELPFSAEGELDYSDGKISFSSNRLSLGDNRLSGSFSLDADQNDLTLSLDFSSPNAFVFANEAIDLGDETLDMTSSIKLRSSKGRLDIDQLQIRAKDGTVLSAQGDLRYGDTFDGSDLNIEINIASLQRLGFLIGAKLPAAPLSVKADVSGDPRRIAAKDFTIASGESVATGTLRIFNPEHPEFQLTLRSDLLDLRPFVPAPAASSDTSDTTDKAPASSEPEPKTDGRVIPETPIDLSPLRKFEAVADIDIKRVIGHTRQLKDVALDAEVRDGQLIIKNAMLTDEQAGAIKLSGFAHPQGDASRVSLLVTGSDINIGFPATSPAEVAALPRLDIEAMLFGDAKTVRELFTKGTGFVLVEGGTGKAPTLSGGLFTYDFLDELLNLINPFRKNEPYTAIHCSALVASLENGKLSGSPLFTMVTDRLAIVSEAQVDLRSEKLFASFNTVPQRGLGLSATTALNPFVGVGGTLASPQLTVDPTGTLVEGGLAFFTGGLSIVGKGLLDRITTGADACEKAVKSGAKARSKVEDLYATFK